MKRGEEDCTTCLPALGLDKDNASNINTLVHGSLLLLLLPLPLHAFTILLLLLLFRC